MNYHRLALLGDPVEHSRSPEIHRVLLELSGLEGEYAVIRADHSELAEAIAGLRDRTWQGLNVTMPLKREAAGLADRLSAEATRSRSVNTLVLSDDVVVGHSTDALAFSALFADPRFAGVGPIHLLGAGGSAAAALAVLGPDTNLYLSARRPEAALQLIADRGTDSTAPTPTKTHNPGLRASLSDAANPGFADREVVPWETAIAGALVVNTTPVGMAGERLPAAVMESATGLIDLPYATEPTPAVITAAERGIPFADGHEFLVRQAIVSFQLWTGVGLDYETVISRLTKP